MTLRTLIQNYGFTKVVDEDLDIIMYERVVKDLTFMCVPKDRSYPWTNTDKDMDKEVVVTIYESNEQVTFTSIEDLFKVLDIIVKSRSLTEVIG